MGGIIADNGNFMGIKMYHNDLGVIVLAAGKGTRMNSDIPKVLHLINGMAMIFYVLESAVSITEEKNIVLVVGHQAELVKSEVRKRFNIAFALQEKLAGTGDAVRVGLPYLPNDIEDVLILCGDVPLISSETLFRLVDSHKNYANDFTVLAVNLDDPAGYGRILLDSAGDFLCIREDSDANSFEKQISLVNSGIYCVNRRFLENSLSLISRNNAQTEYYLTDLAGIARTNGAKANYIVADNSVELRGVNTVQELKSIEKLIPALDL